MIGFSGRARTLGMVVALCVGCGDAGDLRSSLLAAECGRLFHCAGSTNQTANDRLWYASEDGCVDASEGFDLYEENQFFVEAGTVVVDYAAADRCLAAQRATCSPTVAEIQACGAIFVGQVAAGGECQRDVECASGLCTGHGSEQCGTCGRLVATGDECVMFVDACEDGPNGEWGACSGGICLLNGDGYPTEDAGIGAECDYYQLCKAGLFCENGTCAAWRSLGEACNLLLDSCGRGTICRPNADDPTAGSCVAVRIEYRPGAPCGALADEVVLCNAADLYCDYVGTGACQRLDVDRPLGEICDRTSQCAEGLTCLGGTCFGELLPEGSACEVNAQCANGSCAWLGELGTICGPQPTCP